VVENVCYRLGEQVILVEDILPALSVASKQQQAYSQENFYESPRIAETLSHNAKKRGKTARRAHFADDDKLKPLTTAIMLLLGLTTLEFARSRVAS